MIQLRKFLIILLLLVDVCALKGRVAQSRGLKEDKDGNENDAKKESETGDDKSPKKEDNDEDKEGKKGPTEEQEDKEGKKGPTEDQEDKEGKKSGVKEGKKCKRSPISKKDKDKDDDEDDDEDDDLGEDSDNSSRRLDDGEGDNVFDLEDNSMDDDLLDCPLFVVDADCSVLETGGSPSVPDSADGAVGGTLKIEVTSKMEGAAVEMKNSLEKMVLKVVGCDTTNLQRKLQENEMNTTQGSQLNGIMIGDMSTVGSDCSAIGQNCTMETLFTIYFSGNTTLNDLQSMAYSLSDTVLSESDDGEYDDFVDVYSVEATLDEDTLDGVLVESPKTASEGPNLAGVVGGTVGGLAVVGSAAAGYMYYKTRKSAPVNPSNK